MSKTKTKLLIVVLLMMIISLIAQEDSSKAIVRDAQGVSTGLTRTEYNQFKKDYMTKFEKLKPQYAVDWFKNVFFDGKCNLNKYEELAKLKVNIFPEGNSINFESMSVAFPLVLIGTVKSVEYLDENLSNKEANVLMQKMQIASFYNFEVEQVVKGQELLNSKFEHIPSVLKIGSRSGKKIQVSSTKEFTIGQKYLLIAKMSVEKDLSGENYILASPLYTVTDNNVNFGYKTEPLHSCILRINILQDINDEKNFYKLNFKE